MALIDPCLFLQADAHPARSFRQLITATFAEGILGSTSFAVSQRAAGANFSVDIAAGMGVVKGDSAAQQGHYLVVNDATVNDATTVITSAPSAGNERYDRVILEVQDNAEDASGQNRPRFRVVAGTPATVGTAVAPTLPNTAITLAIVGPIVNSTTTITNSLIVDGRTAARLASQVVDTAAIVDSSITSAKIVDGTIVTADLADSSVTSAKIVNGTIVAADIANDTLTDTQMSAANKLSGGWTAVGLLNGWTDAAARIPLQYKKHGNVVFLVGCIDGDSVSSSVVGVMPVGFRPSAWAQCQTADGVNPLTVESNGTISAFGPTLNVVNLIYPV